MHFYEYRIPRLPAGRLGEGAIPTLRESGRGKQVGVPDASAPRNNKRH
ncbi:MAG: hypothetical protein V1867_06335 [Candidatus Falkowbacteria bacterium]